MGFRGLGGVGGGCIFLDIISDLFLLLGFHVTDDNVLCSQGVTILIHFASIFSFFKSYRLGTSAFVVETFLKLSPAIKEVYQWEGT